MKKIALMFLLVGVACATSTKKPGTDTKTGDLLKDSTVMDSQTKDLPKEMSQKDSTVDISEDLAKKDVEKDIPASTDKGKDVVPADNGEQEIWQAPKCTLSPDDQTGYTFQCDKVCEKILACTKDGGDIEQMRKDCMFRCESFRIEANVELANAFGQCLLNADCSKGDVVEQCQSVIETYIKKHISDVTSQQQSDCQALAQTFRDCGELDETQAAEFGQNCVAIFAGFRKEAGQRILACKAGECSSIRGCYSQAFCVAFWELPQKNTSSETVEPDQDAFIGHDALDMDVPMPDIPTTDVPIPDILTTDVPMPDILVPDMGTDLPSPPDGMGGDIFVQHDTPQIDAYMACKKYTTQTGFTYKNSDICNKQKQCNANADTQACTGFLTEIEKYVSVTAINKVGKCMMETKCSDVPSGKDIMDLCHDQIDTQPTQQQKDDCDRLVTKASGCGWNEDDLKKRCLQNVIEMRQEVIANYLACKDMDCAYLDSCMRAAACLPETN